MSTFGIDVSHHQGIVDWGKVKGNGISFAIMKAMYETSHKPDENFEWNYIGCVGNNIKKGAYIFLGSKSISNPKDDAESFLNILNGRQLEYGIWLDAESANLRAVGTDRISDILITEAKLFEKAGYRVGIYCNADWYNHVLDIDLLQYKFPFWIARYPKNDTGKVENRLTPKSYAEAWQYSSKGSIAGIKGKVDLDIDYSYADFMRNYAIAEEVLKGKWGTANTKPTRKEVLEKAGFSYKVVQSMVNAICKVRKM